jgi:hypothetical protein
MVADAGGGGSERVHAAEGGLDLGVEQLGFGRRDDAVAHPVEEQEAD